MYNVCGYFIRSFINYRTFLKSLVSRIRNYFEIFDLNFDLKAVTNLYLIFTIQLKICDVISLLLNPAFKVLKIEYLLFNKA